MQNKYKIRLLRTNLLAAAMALALWTPAAPPSAALLLWLSVGWLFITALLLDFSHRHSRGRPWQLLPGALLLGLIATAPERHGLLIWAWAALFMLPQMSWVAAFNISAGLLSAVLVAPQLSTPAWLLMVISLAILCVLALARAQQLIDMNGAIRQRLRLIPGLNLWAGEQLVRDIHREQTRCAREGVYGELLVVHVKRHQLWTTAKKLCELTHDFENVYRINGATLATLMLSRSALETHDRYRLMVDSLPDNITIEALELMDVAPTPSMLETLTQRPIGELRGQP
ncbi:hypothetical protein [Vreelandella arcis]|uniref:GGDEF domain-containing protein, diguanylate cyclase (C-di-GMP synthetase) or its enzymatically inactive variants n=1 Tax=Vreelandella arcis TaxID=416873 RepID=A0A1H0EXM0_9GAMM|nr:hypothetical protein [Halomonas arcis]SDN87128.1 hypothetical protein SAMN04487951_10941 [Halomonas arcis]